MRVFFSVFILSPVSLFLEMLPFIPADNLPYFEDFLSRHGLALAESGSTLSSSRSNLRNYPTSVSSITSLLPILCFAPFKPTLIWLNSNFQNYHIAAICSVPSLPHSLP